MGKVDSRRYPARWHAGSRRVSGSMVDLDGLCLRGHQTSW